jgi:hypothetical protein
MGNETCPTSATSAGTMKCQGCQATFYRDQMNIHRNKLDQQLDEFVNELNIFQQKMRAENTDLRSSLLCSIDKWETKSIQKIKEAVKEARQ